MAQKLTDMRKTFRFLSTDQWKTFKRLCKSSPATWSESDVIRYAIDHTAAPTPDNYPPLMSDKILRQIVGNLGYLNNNINQLARRANMGSWPERERLDEACEHVREMKEMLRTALSRKPRSDHRGDHSP